ncbi:glutaredoxin-1 [Cariama cristata]
MADVYVQNKVSGNRVTLFIRQGCSRCRNAMEMFKAYRFQPQCLEVCDISNSPDIEDYLCQTTGRREVPYVFIGGHFIGGFSDLQYMQHQLPRMLQQIGALQY